MKRLLTTIVLILSLIFISPSFAQVGAILEGQSSPNQENQAEKILELQNTARLVMNHSVSLASLNNGGWSTCSGVVIKNTKTESIVLTAKHCIGTVEELYVESILAVDVVISLYDDLAYIKLNKMIPNKTPAIISEFIPKKNDIVIAIGYPSLKLHVGIGTISIRTKDWQFALINVIPGCSGGGAYNEYGELVGIIWGAIGGTAEKKMKDAEIGIFEKLEDVQDFVKKHKLLE